MQMALPSILRFFLLCLLERALLAPGISLRSFLSRDIPPGPTGIVGDERVSTLTNIDHGVVVRPTTSTTAGPTTSTVSTWQSMNTPVTGATATVAATPFAPSTAATTVINTTATSVTVSTSLSTAVAAGATALPVASASGFTLGTTIVIDAGTSVEETNVISGFGSLLLQTPLQYAHSSGVTISTATPAATASATSAAVTATSAAATMAAGAAATPAQRVPKDWKLTASVVMETTAPIFTNEYDASPTGFALTLAERMNLVTGVPMSRFAFYLPNPTPKDATQNVLFCQCNASGAASAFDRATNLSYTCEPQHKEFNTSLAPVNGTNATNATSFLQVSKHVKHRRGFALLQDDDDDDDPPLQLEVGIYPATLVLTDVLTADEVASDIVRYSASGDEAERKFLPTGFWTYKPGAGIKFHGLFPGTVAAIPGHQFAQRENSLPLGPNPGGHGATMPPPKDLRRKAGQAKKKFNSAEDYFREVDSVVNKANVINRQTKTSLKELAESLARASAAHAAWMNMYPYQLPEKYGGDPQPMTAMQGGMDMMGR